MSFYIYLIILFSSVGLCKLYIDNGKNKKHEFWDIQPVSRTSTSINKTDDSLIINPKEWKNNSNMGIEYLITNNVDDIGGINRINNFLKNNYSNYDYYSMENYTNYFISCLYKKELSKNKPSAVKKYPELIGTIFSNHITLYINSKIVEGFYVDLLCIHKKYRGHNLAPELIKSILCEWQKRNYNINIFKIDHKPLPFDYIAEYYYYYYDLSLTNTNTNTNLDRINVKKLDKNTPNEFEFAYNFFYEYAQKYKMYHLMTFNEFVDAFTGNNKFTYILFDNNNDNNNDQSTDLVHNKIIGFYSFFETKRNDIKYIELTYFIGDPENIHYFADIFKKNYKYLIFQDTGNNPALLKILKNIEKGHPTYYHLYNYRSTIEKKDIFLNL